MRIAMSLMVLCAIGVSAGHAQSRWVISLQGGYSVATSTDDGFPSGGGFGSSAFIGRQLGSILTLGAEAGFYAVENSSLEFTAACPPPSPPDVLGCNTSVNTERDWVQLGITARLGPTHGGFRPYGALGLAVYPGNRDSRVTVTDATSGSVYPGYPTDSSTDLTGVGGSIGAGFDWVPEKGRWSLGISFRLHGLFGGDDEGENGSDTFVTLLAGVGYRW